MIDSNLTSCFEFAIEILLISLLTILASALGTISGFGVSTLMVPVMLFSFLIQH